MRRRTGRKMKYHPHGSVLFCTLSIEEGLLLLANPLCESIIKTCLARASALYPVRICHVIVEATHVHMIIVVMDPDHVSEFFRYFKAESAHMINRLLGRNKRTVWCEGYDSPIVLTPTRAVMAIAYLYANPAKDNLETSIDRYPGFSSWEMFKSGKLTQTWKRLYRTDFYPLAKDSNNQRGYEKRATEILLASKETHTFTLEPNAWMNSFEFTDPEVQQRLNDRIVARVRLLEARAAKRRVREKKTVIGRARLLAQVLDTSYRPQRSGRRMWCLSEKQSVRVDFIRYFRDLMEQARAVRAKWKQGDVQVPYPPGLYPPSMPKLANALGR